VKRVLITGSKGFIAQNLISHLFELKDIQIVCFSRENSLETLSELASNIDFVFHFAGVNRTSKKKDFEKENQKLTELLCNSLALNKRKIPLIFASSTQINQDTDYGKSKLLAEKIVNNYAKNTGSDVFIYRFPNLFGKWSKPNYNSVVATFCNNIANNLPIEIHDFDHEINLMYIDDVISEFLSVLLDLEFKPSVNNISNYSISVGRLGELINQFHINRTSLVVDRVGSGLVRALYATYLSYLKPDNFSYHISSSEDTRGLFAEVLKTKDSGQFSFFTSKPGEVRGEHYHHTKNEKFLVVSGQAIFKFRNIHTNEEYSISSNSDRLKIVETIPGWAHNIENIGSTEMLVILWANEVYDKENSDTYSYLINHSIK
jgi:UDP-2-acetamido-2,6-beta-L-arabino-hexul-4-ose reductase